MVKIFCDRCKDDIQPNKEIKVENSIICRECLRQIIARCYNCHWPVYNGDPTYEITPNWSVEYIFGADQSEKIVQCDWCYQKWLVKQKKKHNKKLSPIILKRTFLLQIRMD